MDQLWVCSVPIYLNYILNIKYIGSLCKHIHMVLSICSYKYCRNKYYRFTITNNFLLSIYLTSHTMRHHRLYLPDVHLMQLHPPRRSTLQLVCFVRCLMFILRYLYISIFCRTKSDDHDGILLWQMTHRICCL